MNPMAYASAINRANRLVKKTGVILDSLDVGGGFPAAYPGLDPKPLAEYMHVITSAFNETLTSDTCRLKCEPGRALVAEAASLLANVTLRKGNWLYLNDGAYGSLFDACHFDFPYPVRALRDGQLLTGNYDTEFCFYGPTCDSIDAITQAYLLPSTIQAGDYIEIGQLGAYGDAMRTNFNGFGARDEIILSDEPMLSLYTASTYSNSELTTPVQQRD